MKSEIIVCVIFLYYRLLNEKLQQQKKSHKMYIE